MKKTGIILFLSCIITLMAICCFCGKSGGQVCDEYIRMHIRADSDDPNAQAVKYLVRDAIMETLTPMVAECESFDEAAQRLAGVQAELSEAATAVLHGQGLSYTASVTFRREQFPTRVYGAYTLPAGEYLSLIVELGKAEGQNWWCVIYPPLCFAGQPGVPIRYKSKIAEIISAWQASS